MKTTINNSMLNVINEDMLNETKCMKYVSKPTMLAEIAKIQAELPKLNSNYTPRLYTDKNSKKELFEGYKRLATIFVELYQVTQQKIEKNVETLIKTADVLAEETRAKAEAEHVAKETAAKTKKSTKVDKAMVEAYTGDPADLTDAERKYWNQIHGYTNKPARVKKETANIDKTVRRGDAEERLAKYTAELKEKEAIAEPSKEVRHRIASLKRKIARAEKALAAK